MLVAGPEQDDWYRARGARSLDHKQSIALLDCKRTTKYLG